MAYSTHSLHKEYDMILFSRIGQSRLMRANSLIILIDSYLQWSPLYRSMSHGATWIALLLLRATLYALSRKTRSILIAQKAIEVYHKKKKKFSKIAKRSINVQSFLKYLLLVKTYTRYEYFERFTRTTHPDAKYQKIDKMFKNNEIR